MDNHYARQVAEAGMDVCDEYARHDEGLGVGVYPIDLIPFPHPQCLCYRTEVLPTLEESADMLGKWTRGEAQNPEMDAAFEKWKRENAAELENYTDVVVDGNTLDNDRNNGTMNAEFIRIPHSLCAKYVNYDVKLPDGTLTKLTEGEHIDNVKTIGGKGRNRKIDEAPILTYKYPGTVETEWEKKKGIGFVDYYGESYKAELHWYEEPSVGRVEFKVKARNGAWFIDD